LVVGHRGAAACAPENTMAALREGLAQGADILEMDVQLSADGHVVVFHDERLERTTDGQGRVIEKDLSQLKALDAGGWFASRFEGEPIPTLEEVLVWAKKEDAPLFVELKYHGRQASGSMDSETQPGPALSLTVAQQIRAHAMQDQVMLISFNHQALQQVQALGFDLATGALCVTLPEQPLRMIQKLGANALMPWSQIIVASGQQEIFARLVSQFRAAGLAVQIWGADDENLALLGTGIDCLNADHPARLWREITRR